MAETAALLADEVLPERPLQQWVLSLPYALRFLFATDPDAVTLIQRFGSALNLDIHFHMIFLDMENAWLATLGESGPLDDLIGHSITYRIAVGPRTGQELFTLQSAGDEWIRPQRREFETRVRAARAAACSNRKLCAVAHRTVSRCSRADDRVPGSGTPWPARSAFVLTTKRDGVVVSRLKR